MKKLLSLPTEALILLMGALIRVAGLNAPAVWYDEAFTVNMAKLPLKQMLAQQWIEYSPPLWNLIMRPFAYGAPWVLRLPALAASLASLWVVYRLMQRLTFNTWQRNLSAALVAFIPSLLWTAQDARVYALLSLLYLLAFWAVLDGKWTALGVVSVLMLYAHNTAPFLLAPIYLLGILLHPKEKENALVTGVLSLALFAPWLPAIFGRTGTFWLGIFNPGGAMVQSIYALWITTLPGLLSLAFLAFGVWQIYQTFRHKNQLGTVLTAFITLMPFVLLMVYSIAAQNVFFYRPLIALVLPFALWMGSLIPQDKKAATLVTVAWLLLLGVGVANYSPQAKGARLDNAANYIRAHWQAGDVLYYATGTVALPFDYYLPDLPHVLMNVEHNTGLMQLSHAYAFGIPTAKLVAPTPCNGIGRAWLIYPDDILLSAEIRAELDKLTQNAEPIGTLSYSQAADVAIWLVE